MTSMTTELKFQMDEKNQMIRSLQEKLRKQYRVVERQTRIKTGLERDLGQLQGIMTWLIFPHSLKMRE